MKLFFIFGLILFIVSLILLIRIKLVKISKQKQLKEKEELESNIQNLQQRKKNLDQNLNEIAKSINQKDIELTNLKDYTKNQQEIAKKLLENNQKLRQTNKHTEQHYLNLLSKTNQMQQKIDVYYEQQKQKVDNRLKEFKQLSSKAAEYYFDTLQEAYKTADAAHAEKMTRLKEEQDSAAADLIQLKETRKAAYEAVLKQQEIKQNKDNYRLIPSQKDLQDIHSLEKVKQILNKPRVISMLIWQSFWQPIAKKQFPIILQDKTKTGIYKITSLITDQAYIGQSIDIYTRWCSHCKAGLGIDTPVGNKLYKAIQEDGLQNFTFELLCQCSKEELDEKERYFIELYQADLFGYNGTKGNK